MMSRLFSALRITRKRLVADWLIVTAAFLTIVLATGLLASGPIYADAVTISALRQTLDDAPVTDSNVSVEIRVFPQHYAMADRVVRETVDESLSSTGSEIFIYVEADAYGPTDQPNGEIDDVISFQHFEAIETKATLTAGRWPSATGPPHETAITTATAQTAGITVGDRIEVVNRRDDTQQSEVVVVGLFEIDNAFDPFWFDDDLILEGSVETTGIRKLGPFVVPLETMLEAFTPLRSNAGWRILPRFENLTVPEVDQLRREVSTLDEDLNQEFFIAMGGELQGASDFTVQTGLSGLLGNVDRSITVTRSSVLALLIQLAILAGYALALTAGLLVDTRRSETALLRSRGASPGQILSSSILEGLLLTVPAALLAPVLASLLLGLLNRVGPLETIGLTIDPKPTSEAYLVAALAALLSVVALAWPAYRTAKSSQGSPARHQRQSARPVSHRVGLDVALIALAVVAFWQLQTIGPQLSVRVRGQFGVDPLLVVAPALGLLAGAVLALRIVPLLARAGERIAASGRGTIPALASWQVARRPVRYSRASLLLMMSIGIGFFAAAYATTWIDSQRDQAAHAVGADFKVIPNKAVNNSVTDLHLVGAHHRTEGVVQSMPVEKKTGELAQTGGLGQFVMLDAVKAGDIVTLRSDLAPDFDVLMGQLVHGRPSMGAVDLPGEPNAIALVFTTVEPEPEEEPRFPEPPHQELEARVRVILQDGDGILHRVAISKLRPGLGERRMVADLTTPLGNQDRGTPVYPLRLVNIEIEQQIPSDRNHDIELTFHGIRVRQGSTWQDVATDMDWVSWGVGRSMVIGANIAPAIGTAPAPSPGVLQIDLQTGWGFAVAPVTYSLRPSGTEFPQTFPVVASRSMVDSGAVAVGEAVRLTPLGVGNHSGLIIGTVDAFPTIDPSVGDTLIVDLPTIQMLGYEPGFGLARLDEYWLSAEGDADVVATALENPPLKTQTVVGASETTETLVSDPVALGTIGALTVGFVAAAIFAAVGFAVSATVSARERLIEFALIRALGLSPRQLGGWLILEQSALVIISLIMGTLIGWLLAATILPLITVTQSGRAAVPEVIVAYPWQTIVWLELAVVAVLGAIVAIMAVLLRRIGLGSLLRLGED